MGAGFEKADTSSTSGELPAESSLQTALFDAVCESLSSAFIVYDKADHMVFASRQVLDYFPISAAMLKPGTRLRDFLGAIYDSGIRTQSTGGKGAISREDWLSQKIASHWRERFEAVERPRERLLDTLPEAASRERLRRLRHLGHFRGQEA